MLIPLGIRVDAAAFGKVFQIILVLIPLGIRVDAAGENFVSLHTSGVDTLGNYGRYSACHAA